MRPELSAALLVVVALVAAAGTPALPGVTASRLQRRATDAAASAGAGTLSSVPSQCKASTNGPPDGLPAVYPTATGTYSCTTYVSVAAGTTFDGGMYRFDRGAGFRPADNCVNVEAGTADTIFILEEGATLQNVIIGQEVFDSVYCKGNCALKNVWFERTCEDSWSLKDSTTCTTCKMTWTGGAINGFFDKGVQHNGAGTVYLTDIDVYYVESGKGKFYRSCGGCGYPQRNVVMTDIRIHGVAGEGVAGINGQVGDTATFSNVQIATSAMDMAVCEVFPDKTTDTTHCIFKNTVTYVNE
ncbi:hypothetical protein HK405_011894 [Cladochytrium tenue]|nr:hypothetical protein HK405_011894 [Cladochytrium tenue]